jgi:hypothetical protein
VLDLGAKVQSAPPSSEVAKKFVTKIDAMKANASMSYYIPSDTHVMCITMKCKVSYAIEREIDPILMFCELQGFYRPGLFRMMVSYVMAMFKLSRAYV